MITTTWYTARGDRVEVYRSGLRRRWFWRVIALNGKKVASGGQAFARAENAVEAAERNFPPGVTA